MLALIFLLFVVSLYLGFSGSLDKNHILLLSLSFLSLLILTAIMFKNDMQYYDLRSNIDSISFQIAQMKTVINPATIKNL